MIDKSRYLITTADEQTWKFDEPVIFLGEWCRLYDRKHIWTKMDAVVAKPYGLGQSQKDRDYKYTNSLEEELIRMLQQELNEYHGTDYSLRYWRILLGHWLRRYVNIIFNRYQTLKQCLDNYSISGITLLRSESYYLATQDSYSFIWASNDNIWNNILDGYILDFLKADHLEIDYHSLNDLSCFRWIRPKNKKLSSRIKRSIYHSIDCLTNFFVKKQDAFIISSYLPILEEAKLHLELGQIPKIWRSPQTDYFGQPNTILRKDLAQHITSNNPDKFSRCAYGLLFQLLPICYLEGFNYLSNNCEDNPWPKEPKFIFTSNNFDTDEVFKYWTATKVEKKVPYFTGQHGNNYGTHRYANPTIEESTADKFLTWGWTDGLPQHTPSFIFKTSGRKRRICDPQGKLLLIEFPCPHRITTWDGHAEFKAYFEDQKTFVSKLLPTCQNALTIRLHSEYRYHDQSEERQWCEFDSDLNIDTGQIPIEELVAVSRLVVHSYDSTGILETLSENIPTLAFWQNGLEHLRDSAVPYYQLLIDAGIIYLSPESIAQKVNDIWNNIPEWWYSTQVQDARQKFCDRYARTSKQPVKELKQILNNHEK